MREGAIDNQSTILVTGVNGQVGYALLRSLQGLGKIVGLDRAALNLADFDRVRAIVRELRPAIIVNPAAYTAVDKAESDEGAARVLNAQAPAVLAEEAARSGAMLIHYSTDYVFDGRKDSPYTEDDETNPQNIYGLTKLEGERAIASSGCNYLILRTSWIYGMRGTNFLLTMLKLAQDRTELRIVADQFGAPTWCGTIAALTAHILAQCPQDAGPDWWAERSGVYNLSATGRTTWAAFAQAIFEYAQLARSPAVIPISASEWPTPAARPSNSVLSHSKLASVFGIRPPEWRDALSLCLAR
jgi:dTDP-4-dehydrorhamnose reductase